MKKVLAILLALLVGAAAAAGGIFYFHMKAQPKVDAKGLMERLEESSELTVEKSYYTGIVRFEEGTIGFIDKNGFNMKYEAEIDAGFELENVNIEVNDDSVVVTVPEAKILARSSSMTTRCLSSRQTARRLPSRLCRRLRRMRKSTPRARAYWMLPTSVLRSFSRGSLKEA